ncbi:MAG TPA: YueI family protein [Pseudoneobacillus sp.]|nr:YueI family protein [Pseudoneobacillus sp.]
MNSQSKEVSFLERDQVDEYLQQGIYGPKEIKPDERKRFLGTLRERIVVALTQSQVRESKVLTQIEKIMKDHPKAHLYLNGQIEYNSLSKYLKVAGRIGIPFTIVNNKDVETDIGLVLAYDYAIDKEDIFINQVIVKPIEQKKESDGGIINKLKKFF